MAHVEALILAAGLSSRMGTNKLLLNVKGSTIIEKTVAIIMATPVTGVSMVLGNAGSDIKRVLATYPISFIENPNYASGMSSSVRIGIKSIMDRQDIDAVLVMLGDMPLVLSDTVTRLIQEFEENHSLIIAPRYHGRRGNPVLFSRAMFRHMLEVKGDNGAREIINIYQDQVLFVDVNDPGIIIDLDTKEDLQNNL
jgi:molybdenum cofactor cytidylyltransferase